MHSIFVTVEEFLANGGTLVDGKGLFTQLSVSNGDDRSVMFKQIGWHDASAEPASEGMVTVYKSDRTFITNNFLVYVSIWVTPIYK